MSGPVTATGTTIHDVWIYTKQRRRKPEVFDLSLSPAGVVVLRPGRSAQRLGWDRISEWEIEKRQGYLLLTLRGGGSTSRLVVTGWSVEDLDQAIQQAMHAPVAPPSKKKAAKAGPATTAAARTAAGTAAVRATATKEPPAAVATGTGVAPQAPKTAKATKTAKTAGAATVAAEAVLVPAPEADPATATSRSDTPATAAGAGVATSGNELADALATEPGAWQQLPWKPIVTAVLLGVVAFAVLVVLLQSAGIIDWGFLGPTA